MSADAGDAGSEATDDPELTLSAVVRGETRIRWTGLLVFVPGRVLMGCLGVVVLAYYGASGLVRETPTLGRASRTVPEGWTIYPVAAGTVFWAVGVAALAATGPSALPSVAAFLVGWAGTAGAVALDLRASGIPRPRLDRAAFLLAVAVPVTTGPAAAVYLSGRMQRAAP